MQVSCPQCQARFAVPDAALGIDGRTVKCARCAHKWFQKPAPAATPTPPKPKPAPAPKPAVKTDFGLDDSSFPPPPVMAEPEMDPDVDPISDFGPGPLSFSDPTPGLAAAAAHAFNHASDDMDLDDDAPPLPPKASVTKPGKDKNNKKKRGTLGLWLLLVVLLLIAAGGAAYLRQDTLVAWWPPLEQYLIQAHLRHEKFDAGLEMRNAGVPERTIINDVNVLIVRGIVANISARTRVIPMLKLVLFDKNDHLVQEKLDPPPVQSLEPGGTASFKIVLERPDPEALKIQVLFIERPAEDHAASTPAQPAQPPLIQPPLLQPPSQPAMDHPAQEHPAEAHPTDSGGK